MYFTLEKIVKKSVNFQTTIVPNCYYWFICSRYQVNEKKNKSK